MATFIEKLKNPTPVVQVEKEAMAEQKMAEPARGECEPAEAEAFLVRVLRLPRVMSCWRRTNVPLFIHSNSD